MISAIEYLKQTQDTIEHIFNAIEIEEGKINKLAQGLPAEIEGLGLRNARDQLYKNYVLIDNDFDDHFDEPHIMHEFIKYAKSSNLIVAHEITVGKLCIRSYLNIRSQLLLKLDYKSIHSCFPISDGHCPFFGSRLDSQINHLHSRIIVRKQSPVLNSLANNTVH